VSVALTSAEVIDLAGSVDWRWITGVSQLGLSQTVGHAQKGRAINTWQAAHAYSPLLTLQSRTHSHTSWTRLLPSWVNAMGLL